MYIKEFKIKNFRGIDEIHLSFREGVNVIIGENNTGKTAVLDALRVCLGLGYGRREVYISNEDFFMNNRGEKSEYIKFHIKFGDVSQEEQGIFIEMLTIEEGGEPELQLHIRFSRIERKGIERIQPKYWGGVNEGQQIPNEVLDLLYHVYLEPLRNSDRDLSPGYGNRLGQLFMKLLSDEQKREQYAQMLNKVVDERKEWKDLRNKAKDKINKHLEQTSIRTVSQNIDIDFMSLDFKKIVEGLKVFLPFLVSIPRNELIKKLGDNNDEWKKYFQNPDDEELRPKIEILSLPHEDKSNEVISVILEKALRRFEVSQNGLGYNNLIFIATVLGDIIERKKSEKETYVALLIEEPEAHLHPQLQDTLFSYFGKIEESDIQSFITSHSPTITAKTNIDSIIVMQGLHSNITATPLKKLSLEKKHKKYLQRFLDVTKSQLFFAKGVILIEGISEALLLPVFADKMGEEYNLDKHGIEVVNIGGVAFEAFARLFNSPNEKERLNVRCAIITDDDKTAGENGEEEEPSSRAKNAKEFRGELLQVFFADRTFEYELYLENEDIVKRIYEEMHERTKLNSSEDRSRRAEAFVGKLKTNKDKAVFAQQLAEHLMENENDKTVLTVPNYMKDAIRWVINGKRANTN